jgi:hypothetical protein
MKIRYSAAILCCLLSLSLFAQESPSPNLVRVDTTLESILLEPLQIHETYYLTVSGQGTIETFVFDGKDLPYIDLFDLEGSALQDGNYTWEITAKPKLDDETRSAMTWARETGDYSALSQLRKNGAVISVASQSGYFTVHAGQFVVPGDEPRATVASNQANYKDVNGRPIGSKPTGEPKPPIGSGTVDTGKDDADVVRRDQVIADDLIVDGSLCVGFDCVNGEVFSFDTIRLKENNLRIKFDDTSTVASYPSRDWQLTANDSANGGAAKFSIDDVTAGRTPFTVEGNAPSHALYVDDRGNLGLGTSTPVVDIHAVSGDTPTLRLAQDGSSGFAPQTWDLAGNQTSFFLRDATNGSTLPFRVRPGAASQSLVIDSDNDIGIGILTAAAPLHVFRSNGEARALIQDTSSSVADRVQVEMQNNGGSIIRMENTDTSQSWLISTSGDDLRFIGSQGTRVTFFDTGRITMGTTAVGSSTSNFDLDANTGALIIQGSLTEMSDRNSKEDIVPVNSQTILDKVKDLEIAEWSYIDTPGVRHMGPMAQDFRAAFGLGFSETGLATRDLSAVAVASVKALNEALEEKNVEIEALASENDELRAQLSKLDQQFARQQNSLDAENEALRERLTRIESALKTIERK